MYEWFTSFHYVYYKNNVYRVTSEISWVFREWNKRSDILLLLIACYSVAGWFTSKSLACRWLTHGTEVPCRSVKFELLLWTVDSRYYFAVLFSSTDTNSLTHCTFIIKIPSQVSPINGRPMFPTNHSTSDNKTMTITAISAGKPVKPTATTSPTTTPNRKPKYLVAVFSVVSWNCCHCTCHKALLFHYVFCLKRYNS